jgi:hypothetical protein
VKVYVCFMEITKERLTLFREEIFIACKIELTVFKSAYNLKSEQREMHI